MASALYPVSAEGGDEEEGGASLELQGMLHALLQRSWVIVLLAIIAGVAATAYVQRLPDFYKSYAVIEVETFERTPVVLPDPTVQNLESAPVVETIVQNFYNRSLMERVGKALRLSTDAEFLGFKPAQPVSDETVTQMLLGGASAKLRIGTRLIDVSFVHTNPLVAQRIANSLIEQFLKQGVDQRKEAMEMQNKVLSDQAEELRKKLDRSEKALADYKVSVGTVSVEDRRNFVEEKLRNLATELNGARGERIALQSDVEQVKQAGDRSPQLLTIASIAQDQQVLVTQDQVKRLEAELATTQTRYRERHPVMISLNAQLANARRNRDDAVRNAPGRLGSRFNAAVAKETSLQAATNEQEKSLLELQDKVIPYEALKRESDANRALYENILSALKISNVTMQIKPVSFHVAQPAIPAVPLANRRLLLVVGAVASSAMLAAAAIAGLFLLNSSIRTVDAAERLLGLPVLAAVPMMRKLQSPTEALALTSRADSPTAESFRTLRSSVSLLGPTDDHRVFLFTSALPGEGKSFTAANAAISFAQQGLRTLIVDADLRRPSLSKLFGMSEKLPGIADYMVGQPASVHPTKYKGLALLPAGSRAPNPAELLSNKNFKALIEWAKRDFDRIVIDTAPVNVVSDTLNIVSCASVICLVIHSNSTSRKVVRRAIELLHRAGVRPDGIVLNRMPEWNGMGHYYHYSTGSKYGGEETYGNAYTAEQLRLTASSGDAAEAGATAEAGSSKGSGR